MITQTDQGDSLRYTFDTAGEGFPRHVHTAALAHAIRVESGSVNVVFDDRTVTLTAADGEYVFDNTQPHALWSREPAVIVNRFINGRPAEYNGLGYDDLNYTLSGPTWQAS
jgi:hypothetical protein